MSSSSPPEEKLLVAFGVWITAVFIGGKRFKQLHTLWMILGSVVGVASPGGTEETRATSVVGPAQRITQQELERVLTRTRKPSRESCWELNRLSWEIVRQPVRHPAFDRTALEGARVAVQLKPVPPALLNTLGAAQFRVGDETGALQTLEQSQAAYAAKHSGEHPADLAFLAMTHHRLGHPEQAREMMAKLRKLLRKPRWKSSDQLWLLLQEAEEQIATPVAGKA